MIFNQINIEDIWAILSSIGGFSRAIGGALGLFVVFFATRSFNKKLQQTFDGQLNQKSTEELIKERISYQNLFVMEDEIKRLRSENEEIR